MSTNQKSGSVLVDFLGSKKIILIGKLLLTTVKIQFEKKDEANKQLLLLRDEHTRGGDTAASLSCRGWVNTPLITLLLRVMTRAVTRIWLSLMRASQHKISSGPIV